MKKFLGFVSVAALALAIAACGSADKMAKMAEQVTVTCNPSPLAVKGGKIDADLTVTYPADFFAAKAILEVVPVLVYEGGEVALDPIMFQGEKVKDNYTVVPQAGSTVKQHICFPYKEGMAKSALELRARATANNGKTWVDLPTRKVADGCNITELLACGCKGKVDEKAHNYQETIAMPSEGQILYNINSAQVRNSEIKGQSVKDFQEALKEALANERKTVKGVEVVAYASPEGPTDKNERLSDDRSKSAKKAFDKLTKKEKIEAEAIVKSLGEDWEGFQKVVNESNIQDKDLILRVLNMYSDSNVREREIRNMSAIFKDLAEDVLPQLRRARFVADVEYKNYTDEELLKLITDNMDALDEEALLKAATICDAKDRKALYAKAAAKYNSERARYNLACCEIADGNFDAAQAQIAKCSSSDADVQNLKGVIAMHNGEWVKAKECFNNSATPAAVKNLGTCAIHDGDYATAAAKCGNKGCDAAVARLLNSNDIAGALNCIKDDSCAKADYIRAICYARDGKVAEAKAALKKASDACDKLAKRAETDIEFATLK